MLQSMQTINDHLMLFINVLQLMNTAHGDQRRKNSTNEPYINHPIRVCIILHECGVRNIDILMAGLLHDTIEDSDVTQQDITDKTNSTVASIVVEVTNPKDLDKLSVKKWQVEHSRSMSDEAKLVKLADKIDNLTDLLKDPPLSWSTEYIDGYFAHGYAVCLNLVGVNGRLDSKARQLFEDVGLINLPDEVLMRKLDDYYQLLSSQ